MTTITTKTRKSSRDTCLGAIWLCGVGKKENRKRTTKTEIARRATLICFDLTTTTTDKAVKKGVELTGVTAKRGPAKQGNV